MLLAAVFILRARVAQGRWRSLDGRVRAWFRDRRSRRGVTLAEYAAAPGKPLVVVSLGVALGAWLERSQDVWTSLVPAVAALFATSAQVVLKRWFRRVRPPLAIARGTREPSFPSGHAAGTLALLAGAAHALDRAHIVPLAPGLSLAAVLALATGGVQLYRERHWFSDVLAGYLLGASVLLFILAASELFAGVHG